MNRTKRMLFAVVAALTIIAMAAPADAQSSKAAWRFHELVALGTATANSPGTSSGDTGWVDILTTHIKTPNGKELAIGVSLQCGLVTETKVASKGGASDTSSARGRIKVRVQITQPNGDVVNAEPDNGADLTDTGIDFSNDGGVTYCDRFQQMEATFAGLNCTADLETGVVTCTDPETLRLLLKTLNAHHFNFIHANAVPGVQKVVVQARAEAGTALGSATSLGSAKAEAFAGAGVLSVETIRLVKDADGTTDLDNLR
jgi:hypothetical protein